MKHTTVRLFIGFAVLALFIKIWQEPHDRLTGIYSDLEYHDESGDLAGTEIFLINTKKGYYIYFQSSDGSGGVPVVVPAKLNENKLTFEIPEDVADFSGVFQGQITDRVLSGRFTNGVLSKDGTNLFNLPKKNSYWQ
jgi:hypothetical protein